MYHIKLAAFFESKGLKQKEVAEILGCSAQMMGRYLKGKDKINSDFIQALVEKFPEIDLQYIFTEDAVNTHIQEPSPEIYLNVDSELKIIEEKISLIRTHLARKRHDK